MLGVAGWYSTNILGNRDGEVLDDPESFKTKEESKLGVLEYILQPQLYPELYGNIYHKVRINYYPPRGDNKEGWDNIDIFGWLGYPMQIKVDFLCRDSILAAPLVLDLALFFDLAQRAGHVAAIQEWLSFYFKSPQVAPGLYPEHDLFIQQTKLKNTLRWLMGEEQITHLGHRVLRGSMRTLQSRRHEILPSHAPVAGDRAGAVRASSSARGSRRRRRRRAAGSSPAPSARSASRRQAEGGHYTLVTVETDQAGRERSRQLAKRFLTRGARGGRSRPFVPSAPTESAQPRRYPR